MNEKIKLIREKVEHDGLLSPHSAQILCDIIEMYESALLEYKDVSFDVGGLYFSAGLKAMEALAAGKKILNEIK